MPTNHATEEYERTITPVECLFARSPYSVVTMVARIRGCVTEAMLRRAVGKVRQRHPQLRVRIVEDGEHALWFTSEGAGQIPVVVVPRECGEQWIDVARAACRSPFEFDARPAIRFILVQSPGRSELVIVCHHIICDGLSLAYLARDLMQHLGDAARPVEALREPVPIGPDSIPQDVALNRLVRYMIGRMNRKWQAERVVFDQEDYRSLHQAYWARYDHQLRSVELSEAETLALVERCRRHGVTVNSALTAAFAAAQALVQGEKRGAARIGVAASLRDRLQHPAGEAMGFYAGMVTPKYRYDCKRGFWDNAQTFHRQVRPLFTNKNLFHEPLTWSYLDPTILEAIPFKKLGGLVPTHAPRYQKLHAFAARDDLVRSILRREKMASLDSLIMGTAVTNLGRLDLPARYGPLELERLIMEPGGGFPLANVNLVLGAVTCAGRLSLVLEFVEENIELGKMAEIEEQALAFLLEENG